MGLRPTHYPYLFENGKTQINWFEIISENFMDSHGRPAAVLEQIRTNYPIAVHGVSMSIASPSGLNLEYVKKLKKFVQRVQPITVSDHLCWTGIAPYNLHDLLPVPFTLDELNELSSRVDQVQNILGRQILLENVSSYITYKKSELNEWDFIRELCKRSGCGFLFDINNLYVNAKNHGFSAAEYINAIPAEIIGQIHLAGFSDMGDFLFDTHSRPVYKDVWPLYQQVIKKAPNVPVIIEWDEDIPEYYKLELEAMKAKALWMETHHAKSLWMKTNDLQDIQL